MWKHLVSLILSEDVFSDNISLEAKVRAQKTKIHQKVSGQ